MDGVNIHFLNVGAGDCTIIHFPERQYQINGQLVKINSERIMFIDINSSESHNEYKNIIDYYKSTPDFRDINGNLKPIFRFVCSHPHMDHITGLNQLINDKDIKVYNFWDLDHEFKPEDRDYNETYKMDWDSYQEIRKGKNINVIRTYREDEPRDFWKNDEDRITILSPSNNLKYKAHYNDDGTKKDLIEVDDMSYALSISINHRKIIFGGDGKEIMWKDVYDNCSNIIKDCFVLKASHHGHLSGFYGDAVKLMNPTYVIFSNSKDQDEENGAEKEYKKILPYSRILKTHELGSIKVKIPFEEQKQVTFESI